MKTLKFVLVVCALYLSLFTSGFARDLNPIETGLNPAKLQGSGKLTWWGLHVYDASFYRSGSFTSPEFALHLKYYKSFSGASIANRSADEMKKIGVPDAQATLWGKELSALLPNVESGQALTAIYTPKQGTVFYHEGKQVGQIAGAEFPKAFFGIWLDPKTSAPQLRTELLGQSCPPPLFNEACK